MATKRKKQFRTRIELAVEGCTLNIHSSSNLDKTARTALGMLNTISQGRAINRDYQ